VRLLSNAHVALAGDAPAAPGGFAGLRQTCHGRRSTWQRSHRCRDASKERRLVAAGEILGIVVLDHVVVGDGRYFSFKERPASRHPGIRLEDYLTFAWALRRSAQ
jgi:hypothetical protein